MTTKKKKKSAARVLQWESYHSCQPITAVCFLPVMGLGTNVFQHVSVRLATRRPVCDADGRRWLAVPFLLSTYPGLRHKVAPCLRFWYAPISVRRRENAAVALRSKRSMPALARANRHSRDASLDAVCIPFVRFRFWWLPEIRLQNRGAIGFY